MLSICETIRPGHTQILTLAYSLNCDILVCHVLKITELIKLNRLCCHLCALFVYWQSMHARMNLSSYIPYTSNAQIWKLTQLLIVIGYWKNSHIFFYSTLWKAEVHIRTLVFSVMTVHSNPEDNSMKLHCCENLRSLKSIYCLHSKITGNETFVGQVLFLISVKLL
jgi:hypothetical protein